MVAQGYFGATLWTYMDLKGFMQAF